jgi:hypothetical protein
MTRQEAVKDFFDKLRQARIDDQKAKGIRASGYSADSQRVEVDEMGGRLIGADYLYFQGPRPDGVSGRKPGGMPPVEAIIEWLKHKTTFQVTADEGPGLRGLAFAIARKIANKGTDIYQGKRPGLSIEAKMAEFKKELVNNIGQIEKEKLLEVIKQNKPKQ